MKRILGLDLGPNSIGWATVIGSDDSDGVEQIESDGSRIIPLDAVKLGDFEKGNSVSQTKERTFYRGARRLRERCLLRRERLHRILDLLGFLPEHYSAALTRHGKFKDDCEIKLAWRKGDDGKMEFIFKRSFEEMLEEFRAVHPEMLSEGKKIPYDWTIYYLRKKALHDAITKQELAWLLLNFNQKRGYYQLRGEDEEDNKTKSEEYYSLKVKAVEDTGEKGKGGNWYNIILENDIVYRRTFSSAPDWVGTVRDLIVTTSLEKDGTPKKEKDGKIKYSVRMPGENDWTLLTKKTESEIDKSGKKVGEYIYDALLAKPDRKIRGKFVRAIERRYYREELVAILETQKQFIPELQDKELYEACLDELYGRNDAYRNSIASRDFTYLFVDDILFYQRPLKSKKSLIANCPYESYSYIDRKTGEVKAAPVKCLAKSNPLYQEFRLWQFVQNLRIYEREKIVDGSLKVDIDVTDERFPTEEERVRLFGYLNDRKNINQETLLGQYFKVKKNKDKVYPYRWNYVEEKAYPCNETRALILQGLSKSGVDAGFLTQDMERKLWHILYSVEDKQEIKQAMAKFAACYGLDEKFVDVFSSLPPFAKEYGAYSEKAIKKLLPLMRIGKYWSLDGIDVKTKDRINKIIDGECDETITARAREKAMHLIDPSMFRGLPLWLACYVVYGRHSEAKDLELWDTPENIDAYLATFKQHSLHNPIVEQVILETLRTVRDIWKRYGKIDEIHIEMGRDMKNPKDVRAKMAQRNNENENTNLRIKALLTEFCNPDFEIDNVRPYSSSQQDVLRIYEEGVLSVTGELPDDISAILDKFRQNEVTKRPTHSDVMRYKIWLDQKYISPYTGRPIPLSRLFTDDYEIEHIIPQSRYFDDSFSNKVICEAEVNKLKDRMLGLEFIKAHHGEKVQLSMNGVVEILSVDGYERLVRNTYAANKAKMKKLLMDDIPDQFIERQLNDTRYISKMIKSLLSNVVREEGEVDAISKNVVTCNGTITDRLKRDWGVADVWNRIILSRFRRLNKLTETNKFTAISRNGHEIPDMPLELQKGFNKKRIDHRHHAMDAIVIACTTRNHVNLLNNEAAMSKNNANRYQLSRKLRRYETIEVVKNGENRTIDVAKEFLLPWPTFPKDMECALENTIVSIKQNLRVINKTTNRIQKIGDDGKKVLISQSKGDGWAIRKSLHKETVFGEVNLRDIKETTLNNAIKTPKRIVEKDLKKKVLELLASGLDLKRIKTYFEENADVWQDVNLKKIKVYYFTKETNARLYATRKTLNKDIDIEKITDSGIRRILKRHLCEHGDKKDEAFSPEGIEEMNRNIVRLNGGVAHKPIYKVRVYEKAEKFCVGKKGNKSSKFVEAAKGTNLFFAVYEIECLDKVTGLAVKKRNYATIPLNVVVDRQKQGLSSAPEDENGNKPLFVLSPNDFVYLPTKEETDTGIIKQPLDKGRIYKMVSCSGILCDFIPCNVSGIIYALPKELAEEFCNGKIIQNEYGEGSPKSKNERAITGEMIKETCLPLEVDRLGKIIKLNGVEI